jgi:Trm5-related predicted tRNA methylase
MSRLCELYPGICLATEEKARKTSVRVVEKCPDIPVAVVQYTFTHKQYTEEREYTERNIHNSKNI